VKIKIYKIIPVVLYGCETWSLTLREEQRLRVLENRMLRRIFAPKRDEVTLGWRKLHNEELHNLYSSPDIIRMIKEDGMVRACSTYVEMRNAYKVLTGKPEGKTPLGRPRSRWENNIKIDVRELGWENVDWMHLVYGRDRLWALGNTESTFGFHKRRGIS
jgi:hypothetical protein